MLRGGYLYLGVSNDGKQRAVLSFTRHSKRYGKGPCTRDARFKMGQLVSLRQIDGGKCRDRDMDYSLLSLVLERSLILSSGIPYLRSVPRLRQTFPICYILTIYDMLRTVENCGIHVGGKVGGKEYCRFQSPPVFS